MAQKSELHYLYGKDYFTYAKCEVIYQVFRTKFALLFEFSIFVSFPQIISLHYQESEQVELHKQSVSVLCQMSKRRGSRQLSFRLFWYFWRFNLTESNAANLGFNVVQL